LEALQWCGTGHILPSGRHVGGEEIREEKEEEDDEEEEEEGRRPNVLW